MSTSSRVLSLCFLALVSLSFLWLCPHSKVEESFSLQAVYDLFYHGVRPGLFASLGWSGGQLLPYDHLQYPGVVPRSFVGPLILAWGCQIVRTVLLPIFDLAEHPKLVQFTARFLLLCFMLHGWSRLASSIDRKTNQSRIGTFLLIITGVQFHMPFYGSRMLANIFATVFCLHAYSAWIEGRTSIAAILLIVTTSVFRCDIILLLFTAGLAWIFVERKLGILQAIRLGVATGLLTLLLTVPLDSILWQRILWPEGEVFFFNTILNKSSEWGVSSWHFYISSSLPKSMVLTLPLVPLAFLRIPELLVAFENHLCKKGEIFGTGNTILIDATWLPILIPAFGFVFLYSLLGHKETRFLFPVIPLFNVAASVGLNRVVMVAFPSKGKQRSVVGVLALIACTSALLLTLCSSLCFVMASHVNYPGGEALDKLSDYVTNVVVENSATKPVRVHVFIDVASAMSGVSLFGQQAASIVGHKHNIEWQFQKAGYEAENKNFGSSLDEFTHLLTEEKSLGGEDFYELMAISGNPWLDWRHMRIQTAESIFIRERKDWVSSA